MNQGKKTKKVKTYPSKFKDIDWKKVAETLNAHLIKVSDKEVELFTSFDSYGRGHKHLIISDNGGEINISEIVPVLDFSIPYTRRGYGVGPMTLATRIHSALRNEPIDYDEDIDAELA